MLQFIASLLRKTFKLLCFPSFFSNGWIWNYNLIQAQLQLFLWHLKKKRTKMQRYFIFFHKKMIFRFNALGIIFFLFIESLYHLPLHHSLISVPSIYYLSTISLPFIFSYWNLLELYYIFSVIFLSNFLNQSCIFYRFVLPYIQHNFCKIFSFLEAFGNHLVMQVFLRYLCLFVTLTQTGNRFTPIYTNRCIYR